MIGGFGVKINYIYMMLLNFPKIGNSFKQKKFSSSNKSYKVIDYYSDIQFIESSNLWIKYISYY